MITSGRLITLPVIIGNWRPSKCVLLIDWLIDDGGGGNVGYWTSCPMKRFTSGYLGLNNYTMSWRGPRIQPPPWDSQNLGPALGLGIPTPELHCLHSDLRPIWWYKINWRLPQTDFLTRRSSKVDDFWYQSTAHMREILGCHCNHGSILHRFLDKTSYWLKKFPTPVSFGAYAPYVPFVISWWS